MSFETMIFGMLQSGSSSSGSSAAKFRLPPVDSTTADVGMTKPSGGTTMELAGFATASLDAAIDGEALLLAMEEDWVRLVQSGARVFSRVLEETRGWRK